MRTLTVVTEAPPVRSGIAETVAQVTAGLRDLGHEVDLCTAADVGRVSLGEFRLTGLVRHWPALQRQLSGYDVVNLHGPAPSFSDAFLALWRTVPRQRRPALVYTHHSEIELSNLRPLCTAYNSMHARLMRAADGVVVSTPSYADAALKAGARSVRIVPHGVDDDPLGIASEMVLRPSRFTVAFVGQLRPYKGVDVLLRAAAALPDVDFDICGTGHQELELRQLALRLGLRNVRWHGAVSNERREEIMRRAHVVALPSLTRAEAFGIVLLEGMRVGAVPIASDLPGVRDVAGATGLLCRPGDPRSLVQALCYLRDDPTEWARRSVASVDTAGHYRWDDAALRYHYVYNEAVLDRRMASTIVHLEPAVGWVRKAALSCRASLMLLDPTEETLRVSAVSGLALPDEALRFPVPLRSSFAGQALVSGEPVVVDDRVDPAGRRRPQLRTAVCVPFSVHAGDVRGVLNLSRTHTRDRDYGWTDVDWATRQASALARRLLRPQPGGLPVPVAVTAA
jgi:glycosyltransferase involved in cell wall biosynthesis